MLTNHSQMCIYTKLAFLVTISYLFPCHLTCLYTCFLTFKRFETCVHLNFYIFAMCTTHPYLAPHRQKSVEHFLWLDSEMEVGSETTAAEVDATRPLISADGDSSVTLVLVISTFIVLCGSFANGCSVSSSSLY